MKNVSFRLHKLFNIKAIGALLLVLALLLCAAACGVKEKPNTPDKTGDVVIAPTDEPVKPKPAKPKPARPKADKAGEKPNLIWGSIKRLTGTLFDGIGGTFEEIN